MSEDLRELFAVFDEHETGILTSQMLKHILTEVDRPEALTTDELDEFMAYAGMGKGGAWQGKSIRVNELLSKLIMGF